MAIFMIIITLALYIILNLYVGSRILLFLSILFHNINNFIFWMLYVLCAISFFVAYVVPRFKFTKYIKIISGYYMGALIYLLIFLLMFDFWGLVFKYTKIIRKNGLYSERIIILSGAIILIMVLVTILYGVYIAKDIQVKNYSIEIDKYEKAHKSLNIAMLSDIHMGDIITYKDIEKIISKINSLRPDIVLISGDVFDGDYYAVENIKEIEGLFKKLESKYGTYAVLGNHDAGKSYNEMVEFFNKANIKLLQDENICISDEFILSGRKDGTPIGGQGESRKSIEELLNNIDHNKPIIMMDHQPTSINEAELNNVDLLLSGHTHKGQLFPGNLITNKLFLVDYGYLRVNKLNIIVSSGIGTWGPPIRICSQSEISNIKLEY